MITFFREYSEVTMDWDGNGKACHGVSIRVAANLLVSLPTTNIAVDYGSSRRGCAYLEGRHTTCQGAHGTILWTRPNKDLGSVPVSIGTLLPHRVCTHVG